VPRTEAPSQLALSSVHTSEAGARRSAPPGDLSGVLTFTAQVKAKGQIGIIPRVVAPLAKINVDLGSRVRAGETLAELDHSAAVGCHA
jgi:multidrug efflux pump subunit AcrA (membrane-fusion protein)